MKSKVIYENYTIYEDGTIVNNKTGKQVKPYINKEYGTVSVNISGKPKQLHRLVAEAFVTNHNPEEYTRIYHKDGNRANNCSDNLQWCAFYEGIYRNYPVRSLRIESIGPEDPNDLFRIGSNPIK